MSKTNGSNPGCDRRRIKGRNRGKKNKTEGRKLRIKERIEKIRRIHRKDENKDNNRR